MTTTLELKPSKTSLTIGDDYAAQNTIEFTITLGGSGSIWLKLQIPTGEDGVLRNSVDANNILVETRETVPAPGVLDAQPPLREWSLGDYSGGVQVAGSATLSVSISNILCRASEKTSQLVVTGVTGDDPSQTMTKEFDITKAKPTEAPKNPILYFIAEPTYRIGTGKVKLSWDLAGTEKATLSTPTGIKSPDASYYEDTPDATFAYTLSVGKDSKNDKHVTVNVLKAGWHEIFALGRPDPGDKKNLGPFPSVIFDPGDRDADALYAIFVRDTKADRQAVLCKSDNGVTDWQIINTVVPEGMESSPGVLLKKRLWLIGGSTVDPAQISNRIWYYNLGASELGWQEANVEGFEDGERMGHACAIIDDDTIWMLGGLDKYRTCVNDVWSLTISKEGPVTVKASKTSAPWPARCMSSAFKYQKKIWVFGGVSSPNGNPLGDLWNSSVSPVSWKNPQAPPGLNAAIATGAATSGSKPRTVFRMRERYGEKGWKTSDCHFDLTNETETSLNWSKSATPSQLNINDEWNAWTSEPHSIAVAGFKDRLYLRFLHRNALYGETVAAPIFVCVNK